MRLSASSIKDSQECNLKGFWKYILKKDEPEENLYGVFGKMLHFIISETIKNKLFNDWNIVDIMYTQTYHNEMLTNPKLTPPKNQGFYWQGKNILKKWKNDYLSRGWDKAETLMLETYFRIPLKNDLQFSGYIDYIMKFDDKIYLIDWKSNKDIITDEELKNNIQLSMYYWASHQLGHEVDEIGLYFLRHSEYKTTKRSDDSTLDLFKNALTIEKAFNEEDLVANYSTNNCKWCGFKDECDAWKNKAPMKYNKFNKNFISIDVLSDAV